MTPLLPEADRKTGLPPLAETGWAAVPGKDAIRKVWKFRNFSESHLSTRAREDAAREEVPPMPALSRGEFVMSDRRSVNEEGC